MTSPKKSTIVKSPAWEKLEALIREQDTSEQPTSEWFTADEYAVKQGLQPRSGSSSRITKALNALVASGSVEKKRFRVNKIWKSYYRVVES